MEDKIVKVVLNATLKRFDGSLMINGASWTGTIDTFPEEIRLAVERNKSYVTVTEIQPIPKEADITEVVPVVTDAEITPVSEIAEIPLEKKVNEIVQEEGKTTIPEVIPAVSGPIEKQTLRRKRK